MTVPGGLERFPIRWNHLIEKDSLEFKELEHVLIEKFSQLFRNRLLVAGMTGRGVPMCRL
ncbi:MAG: hypothetical protein DLM68_12335 [Hyphomicrobiales bacterium]|nr:MAG: hypothetical protein DLM68_12335 [Hyphomicrobiales bacterium]